VKVHVEVVVIWMMDALVTLGVSVLQVIAIKAYTQLSELVEHHRKNKIILNIRGALPLL